MPDVAAFVLARIAEDEEDARQAAAARGADWFLEDHGSLPWGVDGPDPVIIAGGKPIVRVTDYATGAEFHIARHDPARVLADCAAKRAIVDAYVESCDLDVNADYRYVGYMEGLEVAVLLLAQPHADHPDYRDEWRV